MSRLFIIVSFIFTTLAYAANEPTEEELERWFESDELLPPEFSKVNEGELVFLTKKPDKHVPFIENTIKIDEESIESGWVNIFQCYKGLDPIENVEIVYRYKQQRGLTIHSTNNISSAVVKNNSVQLVGVDKAASLCVSLQARIFYKIAEDTYELRNGPFERRFLDGYYPMHVQLNVAYPEKLIEFVNILPAPEAGYVVETKSNGIFIDAWFEGKLTVALNFTRKH
ncbi:MAG: hypothetical protein PVG75_04965 [Thioalkalispiraceae bacterium]|jgi:hypothetical protein